MNILFVESNELEQLLSFQSEFLSVVPQEDSEDDRVSYVAPPYSPFSVTISLMHLFMVMLMMT